MISLWYQSTLSSSFQGGYSWLSTRTSRGSLELDLPGDPSPTAEAPVLSPLAMPLSPFPLLRSSCSQSPSLAQASPSGSESKIDLSPALCTQPSCTPMHLGSMGWFPLIDCLQLPPTKWLFSQPFTLYNSGIPFHSREPTSEWKPALSRLSLQRQQVLKSLQQTSSVLADPCLTASVCLEARDSQTFLLKSLCAASDCNLHSIWLLSNCCPSRSDSSRQNVVLISRFCELIAGSGTKCLGC